MITVTTAAIYFGTGGLIILQNEQQYEKAIIKEKDPVSYDGSNFRNKEVMTTAIEQYYIIKVYPFSNNLPQTLIFIITSISFGILGSVARTVNFSIKKDISFYNIKNMELIPIQGGFVGLIILGISFIIPNFLTNNDVVLSPISIVILCLLGGIMHNEFYEWISNNIRRKLKKTSSLDV